MANSVNSFSYAGTNVTTGAYVQVIASTAIATSRIVISDTSTKLLKLAVGAAGSEVDFCQVPVSGIVVLEIGLSQIPAGSRISLKAIDASATTGFNVITLMQ